MVVANEDSPVFLGGAFETIACCYADHDSFVDAFRPAPGSDGISTTTICFPGAAPVPSGPCRAPGQRLAAGPDGLLDRLCSAASVADVGWAQRLDDHLGAGVPALDLRRLRHHDASIVAARDAAEEAGAQRRPRFDTASAEEFPGTGYDVVFMFDCLPRPRRPGRGCASGPRIAGARRRTGAPRAASVGGQPQSGRTDVLRPVHGDLHAELAVPGGRPRVEGAGRRGPAARGAERSGLHHRASGHRDAVQPNPRGPAIGIGPGPG